MAVHNQANTAFMQIFLNCVILLINIPVQKPQSAKVKKVAALWGYSL
jgi:hypothetical protein